MATDDSSKIFRALLPGESFTSYIARLKAVELAKKREQHQESTDQKGKRQEQKRDSPTMPAVINAESAASSSTDEALKVLDLSVRNSSQDSLQSSQETGSTAQSLLEQFGRRSEPLGKTNKMKDNLSASASATKSPDEAYVGFDNESATQDQPLADKSRRVSKTTKTQEKKE